MTDKLTTDKGRTSKIYPKRTDSVHKGDTLEVLKDIMPEQFNSTTRPIAGTVMQPELSSSTFNIAK